MSSLAPVRRPSVTIFGAGVSGLTVAQELVERGFVVKVVEPTESLDLDGDCEVGGLARSQYSRVSLPEARLQRARRAGEQRMQSAKPVIRVPQEIYFDPDRTGRASDYDPGYRLVAQDPAEGDVVQLRAVRNERKLGEVAAALYRGLERYTALDRGLEGARCAECASCTDCKAYTRCDRCRDCVADVLCKGWNLVVDVQGHCDADPGPAIAREIGKARAEAVRDLLKDGIDAASAASASRLEAGKWMELVATSEGCYAPLVDEGTAFGRRLNNRVCFRVREIRLPGEHGYRFFPRFYRHLDDVMRRTPIYENGVASRFSTLDNLQGLELTSLAFADTNPQVAVLRRRPASLEEARVKFSEYQRALGTTPSDMARSFSRFLRYLTTSSARRGAELENESWWDYMGGPRFSEAMQRYLKATPQAMVAMSVTDSDARTNGNATVQLLLDQLTDGSQVDRTLSGPTSEAWLWHWKRYLERQGVVFYLGRLDSIEATEDGTRLQPVVRGVRSGETLGRPVRAVAEEGLASEGADDPAFDDFDTDDFYVLALPPPVSKRVLEGVEDRHLNDTLRTLKHYDFSEALGSMVGIQFYFRNNFKFFPGHTFFVDSGWRLTSISQLQFWREKRNADSGYLGMLSVDIGNMRRIDTSQARLLAFESAWSAERAERDALGEKEKKQARLAREAADAAMGMRNGLPFQLDERQRFILRRIRSLPWLGSFYEMVDFQPEEVETQRQDLIQPTKDVLLGIERMAEKLPAPICAALEAGAKAMLEVPSRDRVMPADGGPPAPLPADVEPQPFAERDPELPHDVARAGALAIASASLAEGGRTAWESTRQQIADTVWRQVRLGLDYHVARALPEPIFYWIDETLVFDEEDRPLRNDSPLMSQRPGKYASRPGPMPTAPGRPDSVYYEVASKQWVLTGLATKTFTRITTMELSAESGRHAANAILHAVERGESKLGPEWKGKRIGDYCRIWNPEDYELEDLQPMKRVDERLCEEGLPHWMDILGIDDLIEHYFAGSKTALPSDRLARLWAALRSVYDHDLPPGFEAASTSRMKEMLEQIYGREAANLMMELARPWMARWKEGVAGSPTLDPVEWLFRLLYPRYDESTAESLRALFREWADFVEKMMIRPSDP